MAKTSKPKQDTEEEINARMEQALKRALSTPHKTDKELTKKRKKLPDKAD